MPGQPFAFIVDATGTGGLGDVIIDIVHDKQSVPFRIEDIGHMRYRVSLQPRDAGKYRVYLYFNGSDVRGSPISIRVGTHKGSRRTKTTTASSSAERSKISSDRRTNGVHLTSSADHSKTRQSPPAAYKTQSPTQGYRDYSPHHHQNFTSSYKSTSNYATENSTSTYHSSSALNSSRSPVQNNVGRNSSSPSMIKESKEIYSSSALNRSRSPNVNASARSPTQESPSLIKESKDIYASTTVNRPRSPLVSGTGARDVHTTSTIKESKDIYQSSSLTRPRSPARSPMAFRSPTDSPINRSFSPRTGEKDAALRRRGSTESAVVDTSSNVRGNEKYNDRLARVTAPSSTPKQLVVTTFGW